MVELSMLKIEDDGDIIPKQNVKKVKLVKA
jgi:hypothetical protein